jgi:hypothetical protein
MPFSAEEYVKEGLNLWKYLPGKTVLMICQRFIIHKNGSILDA